MKPITRIAHGDRIAGVVDEHLLAGTVLKAKHPVPLLSPVLLELAEPAIAVAAWIWGLMLLPDELRREVLVLLQLEVDCGQLPVPDAGRLVLLAGAWAAAPLPAFALPIRPPPTIAAASAALKCADTVLGPIEKLPAI